MKIWRMIPSLAENRFAQANRRGAWSESDLQGCSECSWPHERRVQPLIIEWEAGSDLLGDFTWPGWGTDVVVTNEVLTSLESCFSGFEPGAVEMVQNPKSRRSKRSKPRVWLPYHGPELFELWITANVDADKERSSIFIEDRCAQCGHETFRVEGIETITRRWDPERQELVVCHSPRVSGQGVFLGMSELREVDLFRVTQLPSWILCKCAVRDYLLERDFSNVAFLEVGEAF